MEDKLNRYMDWPRIRAVVRSEEDRPRDVMGPEITPDGVLVQCFFPGADKVSVKVPAGAKRYVMTREDEAGYFAALLPFRKIPDYTYVVRRGRETEEIRDPYACPSLFTPQEEKRLVNGIFYESYGKLGAHPMERDGVWGVAFAVWAPNALRVSVVGDFNHWDGRVCPMNRCPNSGVFELFIPQIPIGSLYKYELKLRDGLTYLKADPYANAAEYRPATASVVADLTKYRWKDAAWMKKRGKTQGDGAPLFLYEVHLGSFKKPKDGRDFYNYREIAPMLRDYLLDMGYTHVELLPVMEHPLDASLGYQVTGYYAPTSRYGSPEDFMFFVDTLHQAGIGVILDWVPDSFPRDAFGLAAFDGTCLYENPDPSRGTHPRQGTLIFHYGRPQVRNFLMSSALFWADKYHVDGIRYNAVGPMLYLDYGKNDGEWAPNIYGGNENLDAVEFLKHLNSIFRKKYPDVLLIAEDQTAWPRITGSVDDGEGLGFDYKWSTGWKNDFIGYMRLDPLFRGSHHDALTFSMIYQYSERFILSLSHDEVTNGRGSLYGKMPGTPVGKMSNLRAMLGFFTAHPGRKLLFMGQDFGQEREWSAERELDWELLEDPRHAGLNRYVRDLIGLYKSEPALFGLDDDPDGFAWINCVDWEKSMVSFLRRGKEADDVLAVLCNFSDVLYEPHTFGVPFAGKYREILNSDAAAYGGEDRVNARVRIAKKAETDGRPYAISVRAAPLSVSFFRYERAVDAPKTNEEVKEQSRAAASLRGKDRA